MRLPYFVKISSARDCPKIALRAFKDSSASMYRITSVTCIAANPQRVLLPEAGIGKTLKIQKKDVEISKWS